MENRNKKNTPNTNDESKIHAARKLVQELQQLASEEMVLPFLKRIPTNIEREFIYNLALEHYRVLNN